MGSPSPGCTAQIRPNGICVYAEFERGNHSATFHARTGEVNEQKIRRFKRYAQLLLFLSPVKTNVTRTGREFKWRLNFLTFTLPGSPTGKDNLTKAIYLTFQKLRDRGFKHYVWRKEKQKNGNLHWHIIGNHYIDTKDLNKIWNESLRRHCPQMMRKWFVKHHHYYPPSTDVTSIYSTRGAMKDLRKYLQKADNTDGNTFGVSRDLSRIPYISLDGNTSEIDRCLKIGTRLDQEYSSFYSLPWWLLMRSVTPKIRTELKAWQDSNVLY